MASDIGNVHSYAIVGLRLWVERGSGHSKDCPCLICADTRAYLSYPPLDRSRPVMVDDEWGPDSASELLERGPR